MIGNYIPMRQLTPEEYESASPFDEHLQEARWNAQRETRREEAKKRSEDAHYRYEAWRKTFEWREIRYRVLKRDGYLCQCCLCEEATIVHHEEYWPEVGKTPCWHLKSVCKACHDRLHGTGE